MLILIALLGCSDRAPNAPAVDTAMPVDADGDGFSSDAGDCDDTDARLFPYDADEDGTLDACGWRDVGLGWAHSCAIDSAGAIHCWGIDDGSDFDFDQIDDPPQGTFASISAGWAHSCALTTAGELRCWGIDDGSEHDFGMVTDAPEGTFVAVSVDGVHSCAVRTSGEVVCWGITASSIGARCSPQLHFRVEKQSSML